MSNDSELLAYLRDDGAGVGGASGTEGSGNGGLFSTMIMNNYRSHYIFLGLGEDRAYNFNPSVLMSRVPQNLMYFYVNYIGVSIILFVLSVMITPSAIIGFIILGGLWFGLLTKVPLLSNGNIFIPDPIGKEVPQKAIVAVFGIITAFILKWLLSGTFWYVIYTTIFLTLVHAVLRDGNGQYNQGQASGGAGGYYQSVPVPAATAAAQQQPPEVQAQI